MSGICGVIYFDGRPIGDELRQMGNVLQHRGPDGIGTWQDGNVGLTHLALNLFKNTVEKQPFITEPGYVVVADARIDNLEALNAILAPKKTIGVAECIGLAYKLWGEECLQYLIGDFAFAIYDPQTKTLFCGRDHAAVRSLYYVYEPGKYFAFASEIKALLLLPQVSNELNNSKILRYLAWGSALRLSNAETFYKQISILPPAHVLHADVLGLSTKKVWDLNLERFGDLKTDDDYVQSFKETFLEAVRCRIQSDYGISAHLSGGLDSSSICATTTQIFHKSVHSLHFDVGPSADEKRYAEAILKMGGFQHQYLKPRPDLLKNMRKMAMIFDRPDHFTVTSSYHLANAEAVRNNGSRILLTGHDGDSVVGFGRDYPLGLMQNKDWPAFKNNMMSYAQVADLSDGWPGWGKWSIEKRYQTLLTFYVQPEIIAFLKKKELTKALQFCVESSWNIGYNPMALLAVATNKFNFTDNTHKPIKNPFSNELGADSLDELGVKFADMMHEGMCEATDQFSHLGAHYGHDVVHPFYDRRLVELCLAIPSRLKFDGGYRRGMLRRAMCDILPEEVRLRTSKVHFDTVIADELRANSTAFSSMIDSKASVSGGYLLEKLVEAQQWLVSTNDKPIHSLRTLYWSAWGFQR